MKRLINKIISLILVTSMSLSNISFVFANQDNPDHEQFENLSLDNPNNSYFENKSLEDNLENFYPKKSEIIETIEEKELTSDHLYFEKSELDEILEETVNYEAEIVQTDKQAQDFYNIKFDYELEDGKMILKPDGNLDEIKSHLKNDDKPKKQNFNTRAMFVTMETDNIKLILETSTINMFEPEKLNWYLATLDNAANELKNLLGISLKNKIVITTQENLPVLAYLGDKITYDKDFFELCIRYDYNQARFSRDLCSIETAVIWNDDDFVRFNMPYPISYLFEAYAIEKCDTYERGNGQTTVYKGEEIINYYKGEYERYIGNGIYRDTGMAYSLLRIKSEIGWLPFEKAFKDLVEFSRKDPNPWRLTYLERINMLLDSVAKYSKKDIYSMFTKEEINIYEKYWAGNLGGIYNQTSSKIDILIDEGKLIKIDENYYSLNEILKTLSGQLVGSDSVLSFKYKITTGGVSSKKNEIDINGNWKIENLNLYDGLSVLEFEIKDKNYKIFTKTINVYVSNNRPYNDLSLDDDNDGLTNYEELIYGTDSNSPDTDRDGINDGDEIRIGTNPLVADSHLDFDGDGLTNLQELQYGTNIFEVDSDFDGLTDYEEIFIYHTDPLNQDTDGDGVNDGDEIKRGTNPLVKDGETIIEYNYEVYKEDLVRPSIKLNIESNKTSSLNVNKLSENDTFFNKNIPGFVYNAFSFNINAENCNSEIIFKVDKSIVDKYEKEGQTLKFFYLDKSTNSLKVVESQEMVRIETRSLAGDIIYHFILSLNFSYNVTLVLLVYELYMDVFNKMYEKLQSVDVKPKDAGVVLLIDHTKFMSKYFSKYTLTKTLADKIIENFITRNPESKLGVILSFDYPVWFAFLTSDKNFLLNRINNIATQFEFAYINNLLDPLIEAEKVFPSTFSVETLQVDINSLDSILDKIGEFDLIEETNLNQEEIAQRSIEKANRIFVEQSNIEDHNIEEKFIGENNYLDESYKNFYDISEMDSFSTFDSNSLSQPSRHIIMLTQGMFDISYNTLDKVKIIISEAQKKGIKIHAVQNTDDVFYYTKKIVDETGGEFITMQTYLEPELDEIMEHLYSVIYGVEEDIEDYSIDSDNDTLPDYYEQKINEGVIVFSNGMSLQDLSFANKKLLELDNPDTDEDSLLDGEEIKLVFKTGFYNNEKDKYKPENFVEAILLSNPLNPESDYDGIDDNIEVKINGEEKIWDEVLYNRQDNAKLFSEKLESDPYNYNLPYEMDYRWFFEDNRIYNEKLSLMSSILSTLAYYKTDNISESTSVSKKAQIYSIKLSDEKEKFKIMELMKFHGLKDVREYNLDATKDEHVIQYNLGNRMITYNDQKKLIVTVPIRGTSGSLEEWASNFEFGANADPTSKTNWTDENNHKGFDIVANRINQNLKSYVNEISQNYSDISDYEVVYWITGHSRGAGVANILSKKLIDEGEKTFAYTFASPNTTTSENADSYKSIFNIVNGQDAITRVVFSGEDWNFDKYGQTLIQGDLTNEQKTIWAQRVNKNYSSDINLVNKIVSRVKNFAIDREESYNYQDDLQIEKLILNKNGPFSYEDFEEQSLLFEPKYAKPYSKRELEEIYFVHKISPMYLIQFLPEFIHKIDKDELKITDVINAFKNINSKTTLNLSKLVVELLFSKKQDGALGVGDSITYPHYADTYILLAQNGIFGDYIEEEFVDDEDDEDVGEVCFGFVAGTLISYEDNNGEIKKMPIEEINGQKVYGEYLDIEKKEQKPPYNYTTKKMSSKANANKNFIKAETYQIIFTNGKSLEIAEDHPLKVLGKGWVTPVLLEKNDILETNSGSGVQIQDISENGMNFVYGLSFNKDSLNYYVTEDQILTFYNCGLTKEQLEDIKFKYNNKSVKRDSRELQAISNIYVELNIYNDNLERFKKYRGPAVAGIIDINNPTEIFIGHNSTLKGVEGYHANFKDTLVSAFKTKADLINKYFENVNTANDKFVDAEIPDIIRPREKDPYEGSLGPGTHAEVHAVVEAITTKGVSTDDLLIFVVKGSKVKKKDIPGEPFTTCPHCYYILEGLDVVTNDLTDDHSQLHEAIDKYNTKESKNNEQRFYPHIDETYDEYDIAG